MRSYLRWKHLEVAERFPIRMNVVGIDHVGFDLLNRKNPPLTPTERRDMLQYAAIRLKMKDGSYIVPDPAGPRYITAPPEIVRDTVYVEREPVIVRDTVFIQIVDTVTVHLPEARTKKPLHLAVKTNLLYDAMLLPNLTAEVWLGNRWSLAVEGSWSWWSFGNPVQEQWVHRIQTAGAELRYWVKSPYPLHGHALGAYGMSGNYDMRLFPRNEHSKGELSYGSWSAGLSYAYSMPIARKLNLEFGFALGYVEGKYYKYDYCMRHQEWNKRAAYNRHYFGPTRIGISLVWLPATGNKINKKDK
jgi:hypothetical protein